MPTFSGLFLPTMVSERGGSRTEYEIPGRMKDMGVDWDAGFFFLVGRVTTHPERRDSPIEDKFSWGSCHTPGPPGPAPPRRDAYVRTPKMRVHSSARL